MKSEDTIPVKIDTNLYSRQIGAFGLDTMGKLVRMKVLISGLRGLGVEVAKNLILAGPNLVALHDKQPCEIRDMGANFYITENDVRNGTSRAEACRAKLADLNDNVIVKTVKEPLTNEILSAYDFVVVSDMCRSEMIRINNFCRDQQPPKGFIAMDAFGLAASIFVDFGPYFTVHDKDGNALKTALIENIQQGVVGRVTVRPEKPCPFETGDYVIFREVKGMTEINDTPEPFRVVRESKSTFTISDISHFTPYERDGIVEERKVPIHVKFQSLEHCINNPVAENESGLLVSDFGKIGQVEQLHFAIQSVYQYRENHKCLPPIRDNHAIHQCLGIAKQMNEAAKYQAQQLKGTDSVMWKPIYVEDIDIKILEKVVKFSRCVVSPMAAFIGGFVAQEVVKFTGKFFPLHQWFYFDAFEILLHNDEEMDAQEFSCQNCRYDDQISIWGKSFQKRLGALQIFLVGAGALGCEYIKSLALMGCCCSSNGGCLTLTDMDHIETSNLNRQFLFRKQHIGDSKSRTASAAGQVLNPNLYVKALEIRVEPQTENEFNDSFWTKQDIIVNALDNIKSRMYVDGRCVWYRKPLLESGTLGTKGNVQVVLPHMTQSYGETKDPEEESIPLCTLRHFPNQIEHTLQWSRDIFEGLFHEEPQEAINFLRAPQDYLSRLRQDVNSTAQRTRLEKLVKFLRLATQNVTYVQIVEHVIQLFTFYFDHQIAQLLHTFPLDHMTSDSQPFWSGPKRAPTPISFCCKDVLHLTFVQAATALLAMNLGLPVERNIEVVQSYAEKVKPESFVPKQSQVKIDEMIETVEEYGDDEYAVEKLQKELEELAVSACRMNFQSRIFPIEFEKDDEKNFHIDFIWSCGNLRARNYRIPECDRYKAQMIAGKIIPAIATTTALVTGFASLEFLKMLTYKERKIEDFKNAFFNLALPMVVLSEPLPPSQTKSVDYDPIAAGPIRAKPEGFTTWDVFLVNLDSSSTLRELIHKISCENDLKVYILSVGNACLYNDYLPNHSSRLDMSVKTLVETLTKTLLGNDRKSVAIEASCYDTKGIEVVLPTLKVCFS